MILYHTTTIKALRKILRNGLIPYKPLQRDKLKGIYLSDTPFKWTFNVSLNRFKVAHLKIDAEGLELIDDYHIDNRDLNINSKGDFICLEEIEPKRIKQMWINSKEAPMRFKRTYKKEWS